MTGDPTAGAAPEAPAPAPGPAGAIDAQILATWRALRANPDLDAGQALRAIDRLLDQRARAGACPAQDPLPVTSRALEPGSPAEHAVLTGVLRAILEADWS
jgi:hypothetical protein